MKVEVRVNDHVYFGSGEFEVNARIPSDADALLVLRDLRTNRVTVSSEKLVARAPRPGVPHCCGACACAERIADGDGESRVCSRLGIGVWPSQAPPHQCPLGQDK